MFQEFVDKLRAANPDCIETVVEAHGELTITVRPDTISDVCRFMRDELGFDMLSDLCGCDRGPEEDPRFQVNYQLFSTTHFQRLRICVMLPEDAASVRTVTDIWKTADWHERETYDLFGVKFEGHPDLRRILLPSDFDGHALRKDYPLRGYEPYSMN